ncbi:MAG: protein kinase domain-containing protein [Nannocystaceae bacterium]|nr:protein kinase [bacterium]
MTDATWPPSASIAEIHGEPHRVGSEQRWSVTLADGGRGVLAQLLPELARDEAVRRRYVGDLSRAEAAQVPGVARLLDRSADDAPQPWRLREDPTGESLQAWLDARAPAPVDAVAELGAALADTLHALHQRGVVVRDLHPRVVVMTSAGPVLTDIGLARVDLLSTRTAASLVLEGTPYASPEQLRKTFVDQRSDLYGLGVILWRASTGTLPHGDDIALLADPDARPSLLALRPETPEPMARIVEQCVEHDPERRPDSAAFVASVLRGEAQISEALARVPCQSCGASLLQGQRLCSSCGKEAITFKRRAGGKFRITLRKVSEQVETQEGLREKLAPLAETLPELNFIHGDARMYSKEERKRLIALPTTLFADLDEDDAERLKSYLAIPGVKAVVSSRNMARAGLLLLFAVLGAGAVVGVGVGVPAGILLGIITVLAAISIGIAMAVKKKRDKKPPLLKLREGPAALPASDPLVARLAALGQRKLAADVRERLGHLALTVQQVVDHRGMLPEVERKEVDVVTEPMAALVGLIEAEVTRVSEIDAALAELDEGALVRALSSAAATGGDTDAILDGLHRLRDLEQSRAGAMHRLLEATTLLRRAAELGLRVRDDAAAQDREVQLALAALGGTGG